MKAFGTRRQFGAVHLRFNGRLELAQGIFDSQLHHFAGGLAHVSRDPKHPAHGFHFYAQIEFWMVRVAPVLKPHDTRGRVEILVEIAHVLDASFDFLFLGKFFSTVHVEWMLRYAISVILILNESFTSHRQSPPQYRRKSNLYKCSRSNEVATVLPTRTSFRKLLQLRGLGRYFAAKTTARGVPKP
jgi:hypothetical protein